LEGLRVPHEGSLSGLVLDTLEATIVDDTTTDPRVHMPAAQVAQARSAVCAPLIASGEAIGVLAAFDGQVGRFTEEDLFVIKSFADLASIALQNARALEAERETSQLEAELAESQVREAMRTQTLQAVIRAQEEERRRIARELHDSFGQSLASILLGLKVLEDAGTGEEARDRIADLRDVAARAAADVGRIAFELRPTLLDDLGLGPALERYANEIEQRTGTRVTVELTVRDRLDPDVETVVYRVAQEAITNTVKYAEAGEIWIALSSTDGDVRLVVADNGRGFEPDAQAGTGLGLLGMHERAELVGGKLSIRSAPGEGTTVDLYLPGPQTLNS
jgi:signal transduction histidine kinase